MEIEVEARKLEINKEELLSKLESLGAIKKGEYFQKRYVYDVIEVKSGKWIRLRTNGKNTTLTVKEVISNKIDGTKEIEVEVEDFEKTNELLNEMGFYHRAYQENKRIMYVLNDVEIDIDSWPLIPTYVEFEGKEEKIYEVCSLLGIEKSELTSLDIEAIYNEVYGIDVLSIKELKFK